MKRSDGGILLYGVLALVFLGAITSSLQGMFLPSVTTGISSSHGYQVEYLVDSFKHIFRQQLSEKKKEAGVNLALRQLLQELDGQAVEIRDAAGSVVGTVTPKFTPYWFRSGSTATDSFTAPADFRPAGLSGEYDMIAVKSGGLTRFTCKFEGGSAKVVSSTAEDGLIPANANLYFLLRRDMPPTSQNKDTVAWSYANGAGNLSVTAELPVSEQFKGILPPTAGLLGLMSEPTSAPADPNSFDFGIVYGKYSEDKSSVFQNAEFVFGKEETFSSMVSGSKQYSLFLGQHVEASLSVTLAAQPERTIQREWHFNGSSDWSTSTEEYHKDIVEPAAEETAADYVSAKNPQDNGNAPWAKLGTVSSVSPSSGWNSVIALSPSNAQPNHSLLMKNESNGKQDTTLQWARLFFSRSGNSIPILKNYASLIPVNTTYKLSFAPFSNSFFGGGSRIDSPYSYFMGLVVREKTAVKNNQHYGAEGLAVGLLSGFIELKPVYEHNQLVKFQVKDDQYPLDLMVMAGFVWEYDKTSKGGHYYIYTDDGGATLNEASFAKTFTKYSQEPFYSTADAKGLLGVWKSDFENGYKNSSIVLYPRVLVWYFNDLDDSASGQKTNGEMVLLAVGKPVKSGFLPHYSTSDPYPVALHINLEEGPVLSDGTKRVEKFNEMKYNDLRIVLAKSDLSRQRWISMEAKKSGSYTSLSEEGGSMTQIDWLCANTGWQYPAMRVENSAVGRKAIVGTITEDEPAYFLRVHTVTGASYATAGIFSSLVPAFNGQGSAYRTYLTDFGLAVTKSFPQAIANYNK